MFQIINRFSLDNFPKILSFLIKSQYRKELSVNIWGRAFFLKPNSKKLGVDGYIYLHGENYEPEMKHYLNYIDLSNSTFLDIGANAGYWSVYASQMKNCNVISFEPHPVTYTRLKKNIEGLNDCIAFNIGLSNQEGKLKIVEMPDNGSNYLSFNGVGTPIDVTTLDIFFANNIKLNFKDKVVIKIDVEGAEQLVIEGGSSFIREKKPYIIIEMIDKYLMRFDSNVEKLDKYLKSFGYKSFAFSEYDNVITENYINIHGNVLYLIES